MSRRVVAERSSGGGGASRGRVVHATSEGATEGEEVSRGGKRSAGGRSRRERIDYDEKEAMEITTDADVAVFSTFDEMGLKEDLLRGIYAYGNVSSCIAFFYFFNNSLYCRI